MQYNPIGNSFGDTGATITFNGSNVAVTSRIPHTTLVFTPPQGTGLNKSIIVTRNGVSGSPSYFSYYPPIVKNGTGPTFGNCYTVALPILAPFNNNMLN
jgi:hypothetical protein